VPAPSHCALASEIKQRDCSDEGSIMACALTSSQHGCNGNACNMMDCGQSACLLGSWTSSA